MKRVGFFYDDIFLRHIPPGWHPENPDRLRGILNSLEASTFAKELIHIKPVKASIDELTAIHTREYVERVASTKTGYLDPDTYVSEESFEAALYAAGAVAEAVRQTRAGQIERAFCAVRPPGHHAERDRAMGFCLFNNIAIGARVAQSVGYERVLIVDFDVHHGNGTEHAFEEDPTVYYFSTHQYPHYPGTGGRNDRGRGPGEGYTMNIPLSAGTGNDVFKGLYNDVLMDVAEKFRPDIVLVSAGYDIHRDDPLADIRVSDEGIMEIVRGINRAAQGRPVIYSLEGGYNIKALSKSVLITIEELLYD
ncbi:MAG: histone deacetylase [Nitrospirae bacterium]|nr:MAG: histone deacetylase [Nitrospirota bacterium]